MRGETRRLSRKNPPWLQKNSWKTSGEVVAGPTPGAHGSIGIARNVFVHVAGMPASKLS
jgi:hypothetical protein